MNATGYGMDATLEDGVFRVEGRNPAGKAALKKSPQTIPVALIERIDFRDTGLLTNGRMTIRSDGKKTRFNFRKKTRAEVRALYDELQRERAVTQTQGSR